MITDGRYTVVYPTGDYRTLRVKTAKHGNLQGKLILSIKVGRDFEGIGFLQPTGKVNFWRRTKLANPPERLERIQRAVDRVVADPAAAGMAYAMKENCCFRCGRELTVPASIHKGMGPECARKTWTKQDQKDAYNARAAQARPSTSPTMTQKEMDQLELDMDTMVATAERKQEEQGFASDPDYQESLKIDRTPYKSFPESCEECKRGTPVSHNGSPYCRSFSIASGGFRSHCTCDTCF